MECNKEEALRAKEIAQKKMENNDFDGAWKMAMKAKQLFPDLENINQLLAVCNVHCSAQSRILGTEKDWYSVLQLERKVDGVTIKKQYRKLALVLHPDKNQFPGAEAAFKLIGEAHLVLSDRDKKALYDSKIGALSKSAQAKNPPNKVNKVPPTREQNGVHKSMANGYFTQFNVQNNQQTAQFNTNNMQQSFWTRCPLCNISYEYSRNFVNGMVTCQNCKRGFNAFDTGVPLGINQTEAAPQGVPAPPRSTYQGQAAAQGVPFRFNNQLQAFNKKNQDASQGIPMVAKVNQPSVSRGTNKNVEKATAFQPSHTACPPNLGGRSSLGGGTDGFAAPKLDPKSPVEDCGNNKRKRKRKKDAESRESYDASSSSDLEEIDLEEVVSDVAAAQNSGVNKSHEPRRSSRQKHNVSYIETEGDDDDFESPPKRSWEGKLFHGREEQKEAANSLQKGSLPSEGRLPEENAPSSRSKMCGNASDEMNSGAQEVETIHHSESESCSEDDECLKIYDCPDPEFNDFDKGREESCFRVDQFWACYDDTDSMPRFYAQIKEVWSNPFKVRISWLEAKPDDAFTSDWCESELPVACGKYRRGSSGTADRLTFSHQIVCDIGRRKGSFMVYPRRGETWALFRDWDADWVEYSRRPKKFTYDIVEILSEFIEDAGIQVMFLEKVRGFVSLFHRSRSNSIPISIPPYEILRFSHRIPSFRMRGDEKDGVPAGSFELDTAALVLEKEADSKDTDVSKMPENVITPKKSDEILSDNNSGGEAFVLRRSPRGLNTTGRKENPISASPAAQKRSSLGMIGKESCIDSSPSKAEVVSKEINPQKPDPSPRSGRNHPASLPSSYGSQDLFHDFTCKRSAEKFAVGQLWALYNPKNKLPKMYGMIKKIESSPLKLHVTLLESCLQPENGIESVCGTFKVQKRIQILEPSTFSHLLDVKPRKRGTFEIYPEEGHIWALHKNNIQLLSSDPGSCEYDIVEVIGKSEGFIKVLSLVQLKDYKSVFRPAQKNRSSIGATEIQLKDVARFSHRIPAFQLTTEGGGCLKGCWELDPASVPLNISCAK